MSNDRGMMKYIPYQSLTEQSSYLEKMRYEKGKSEKPPMFPEKRARINAFLSSYGGQSVILTYHRDGYPHTIKGVIQRIYPETKCLIIQDEDVYFKEIMDIENEFGEDIYFD